MRKMGEKRSLNCKRAQVTVFVIIAIAIVAVLIVLFYPQLKQIIIPPTPDELVPRACVEKAVTKNIAAVMLHGTSLNPSLYYRYNNISVEYLCYTSEWYSTCVMQKPLLKQSIEAEVQKISQAEITTCINQMESSLKSRGYEVKTSGSKNAIINIINDRIRVEFNLTLGLEKDGQTSTIESNRFRTDIMTNIYEVIMIASSIQNFEARFGDAEITNYMAFYPNLKVEKYKQPDGTKIYIITDRETLEKLQFATRSLAWPPGYSNPLAAA